MRHVLRITRAELDSPEYLAETRKVAELARAAGFEAAPGAPFRSLREWRERLGAERGELVDPGGVAHPFSLERHAGADPDRTMLAVSFFRFNPRYYGPGKLHPLPPDDE